MPPLRDVIAGPWRAVLVLGFTEILAWGAIFYPPVLTVPLIADERGWSMSFAMGGFSLALLTAGLVSPPVWCVFFRPSGPRGMPARSLPRPPGPFPPPLFWASPRFVPRRLLRGALI